MAIAKPNQQLHRDPTEAAALLKWSGVDLMKIAARLSEAGFKDDARVLLATMTVFRMQRASWLIMRNRLWLANNSKQNWLVEAAQALQKLY